MVKMDFGNIGDKGEAAIFLALSKNPVFSPAHKDLFKLYSVLAEHYETLHNEPPFRQIIKTIEPLNGKEKNKYWATIIRNYKFPHVAKVWLFRAAVAWGNYHAKSPEASAQAKSLGFLKSYLV